MSVCSAAAEGTEEDLDGVVLRIERELGYPVYVKPANQGSSVGISRVSDSSQIREALKYAAGFDRRILIEKEICCREIETAVLGNYRIEAAVTGEIVVTEDFL